jgi:glucose-1-phosphate cytidylyltransferase
MLTYGDGVSNINIHKLLSFHKAHGKLVTVTAVQPAGRFGSLALTEDDQVEQFREKLHGDGGWINGGFMVCQPEIFACIDDDNTVLESQTLQELVSDGQLMAYRHNDYWQAMDTLRDKNNLELLWNSGKASWKVW